MRRRPEHRRARALYRRLIRFLPHDLGRRFGPDLEDLFAVRLGAARGPLGRGWVWARAILDLGVHGVLAPEWRPTYIDREDGMGGWLQDLRQGAKSLGRRPLASAGIVGTLALGVGAATATWSAVDGVLLTPLPYPEPDRLVAVWPTMNFNGAMVRDALAASPALESITGYSGWGFTLTGQGEPLEVRGARVSVDHFRVLGARPVLGRDFDAGEGVPGAGDVVVLSHGFWVRAFGADPAVVGRRIALSTNDADTRTVVGVMGPEFHPLAHDPDVWVPLTLPPGTDMADDDTWYVNDRVARLAPGATVAEAAEQIRGWARDVREHMPRLVTDEDVREADVRPLHLDATASVGPVLWASLGAVSLVLLMACANVANLLLARGEGRGHDLALRAALGARRPRIVRLLLVESTLLGAAGGALGIALSFGLVRGLVALAPPDFPRLDQIGVDGSVLLFALGATLLATLVAGVVPALRTSRVDATASLGRAARGTGRRGGSRLTPILVTAEVALAVVVVVGSGLMLKSLHRMTSEELGIAPDGLVVLRPSPPTGRYPDGPAFRSYYAQVLERVEALPEVERAAAIHLLPGTSDNWSFPTRPEGFESTDGTTPSVNIRLVTPGYLETVQVPLLQGRTLQPTDDEGGETVVVVNQAFVDRYWPAESDPLGLTLRITSTTARVVGVVGDVRQHGFGSEPRPEMYFAHGQLTWDATFWIVARVRPGIDPAAPARALRDAVWAVDPDVPVGGLEPLTSVYADSAATTRFLATVLGGFGLLALLLGAVGVFGVTAFAVGRRTGEFGVRVALGARRREVLGTAVGRSLVPVAVGLGVGLLAAAVTSRVLASVLYDVAPSDPATFGAVVLTLGAVALGAALLPAWRAAAVDPATVLRRE